MAEESVGRETDIPKYQFPVKDVDDPHSLIDQVLSDLPESRIRATLHAYRNIRLHKDRDHTVFSLADMRLNRFTDNAENPVIEPHVGALLFKGSLAESRMGSFYTPNRFFRKDDETIELRGANYYVDVDKYKRSPHEKIDIMEKDFLDGLSVIDQVDRPQNESEFLLYLGVLDYLKIHSLTLLHAITFDERNTNFPTDEQGKRDYLDIRTKAVNLARSTVRKYYQAVCGLPFDQTNSVDMEADMEDIVTYARKNIQENEYYKFFTYPEVNNPATVLVGAHEASQQNPEIDTIVGLASGGTESAIAAQLFYENTQGKTPDITILPISFHSQTTRKNHKIPIEQHVDVFKQIYPTQFNGKNVLLIDDNSNTGDTLQTTDTIVRSMGATTTEAHLAQHDPERVKIRIAKAQGGGRGRMFNLTHPRYTTTMGVAPIDATTKHDETITQIYKRLDAYHNAA